MSNPAMPGFLKIGSSSKEPNGDNVREFSRLEGVPAEFLVEYQALVDNEVQEAAKLHKSFSANRGGEKYLFTNGKVL